MILPNPQLSPNSSWDMYEINPVLQVLLVLSPYGSHLIMRKLFVFLRLGVGRRDSHSKV